MHNLHRHASQLTLRPKPQFERGALAGLMVERRKLRTNHVWVGSFDLCTVLATYSNRLRHDFRSILERRRVVARVVNVTKRFRDVPATQGMSDQFISRLKEAA